MILLPTKLRTRFAMPIQGCEDWGVGALASNKTGNECRGAGESSCCIVPDACISYNVLRFLEEPQNCQDKLSSPFQPEKIPRQVSQSKNAHGRGQHPLDLSRQITLPILGACRGLFRFGHQPSYS
jgi:hypothetical protein